MKWIIGLVILCIIQYHSNATRINNYNEDDVIIDNYYNEIDDNIEELVDLETIDNDDNDDNDNWLYENANDFYFDEDEQYDEDYEQEYYNEYDYDYDDDDYNLFMFDEDDYNDYYNDNEISDFIVDDSDLESFYKQFMDAYISDTGDNILIDEIYDEYAENEEIINDYFDELDEFYYNNYILHETYNNFNNIDFSQVLSLDYNNDININYDDMNFQQLLDILNQNEWPSLKGLKRKFKEFKKRGKIFIDKHIKKSKIYIAKHKPIGKKVISVSRKHKIRVKRLKRKIMNKVKHTLTKWKNKFKVLKKHIKRKLRRGKKKLKNVGSFVRKHGKNALKKLAKIPRIVRGVLRSFMFYLRSAAKIKRIKKGNKYGLKPLNLQLKTFLQPYFPGIKLNEIKVAMGVNTLTGQPVTICYDIFFPKVLNCKEDQADLEELIRQVEYALRCERAGGVWPFLNKEIILKGGEKECERIIKTRALDLEDMPGLKKDADDKAEKCIRSIWQQYGDLNAITVNGQP